MMEEQHYSFLRTLTNEDSVISELLAYTANKFRTPKQFSPFADNSPFISHWKAQCTETQIQGVFKILQSNWRALHFPIRKNLSTEEAYTKVTLRGVSPNQFDTATGLSLRYPEALELQVYHSVASTIPVLVVPDVEDFNDILRTLCHKNEPVAIPLAMGAALLRGIPNWKRLDQLKTQWKKSGIMEHWSSYFKREIIPSPELYKDTMILLSTKPYSNVPASSLGIEEKKWRDLSVQIRLAHECFHLFTLHTYGAMANNMHDELIADYYGIRKAIGRYNAQWALHFVGLENYPDYRKGARLENYLGSPPLSPEAFMILQQLVQKAIDTLDRFDRTLEISLSDDDLLLILKTLCSVDLLTLASKEGLAVISNQYSLLKNNLEKVEAFD